MYEYKTRVRYTDSAFNGEMSLSAVIDCFQNVFHFECDDTGVDTVFADLQSDAKDKVVFLISHRLYHFPQMQKVIFMDGGKTAVGTHAQLMETVPLYRQLYESQTVQKEGDLDEE